MNPRTREELAAEWLRNEAELRSLQDLPVGASDPASRERELDARQDAIEFAIGLDARAA